MKGLRVLVLMHRDLVPPDTLDGIEDYTLMPWRTEWDVMATLESLQHEVTALGMYDDLGVLHRAVQDWKPDVVFNMLEEFGGDPMLDQNVVSYLEMMRVPYTGCKPLGLMLARDKAMSKKLVSYHKIHVPHFQVFPLRRKIRRVRSLRFPIFVKSLIEEASLGISLQSIVDNDEGLTERVTFIHEKVGTDAIAEEFIDGREIYLAIMGNRRLTVFPPWELGMKKRTGDKPIIATRKVKFDQKYQAKMGVFSRAARLSPELREQVQRVGKRAYRILNQRGYARMDFRLSADNRLYFIEANPNPQLAYGEDFAESAHKAGVKYPDLIARILRLGLEEPVRA